MKLFELFEGKVKDFVINREFDPKYRPDLFKTKYGVMVSGKVWKKDGEPVSFPTKAQAEKAADTIMNRRNIATQVVPLKK
jgi:hypothetical protein